MDDGNNLLAYKSCEGQNFPSNIKIIRNRHRIPYLALSGIHVSFSHQNKTNLLFIIKVLNDSLYKEN